MEVGEEFRAVHKGSGMSCAPGIKDKNKIAFFPLKSSILFLYYFVQEQKGRLQRN